MTSIQTIEKMNEAGKTVKSYIFMNKEYQTKKAAEAARKEHLAKVKEQKQHEATKQDLASSEKSLKNKKKGKKAEKKHTYTLNEQRKAANNDIKSTAGWIKVLYTTDCKELQYIRRLPKNKVFALIPKIEEEMKIGQMTKADKNGKTHEIKPSKDLVLRWFNSKTDKELKEMCK